MKAENWKPLFYHGEYFGDTHEISDSGILRNIKNKKVLRQNINKQGYLITVISRGRKRKIAIRIHRAVAENFLDLIDGKNIINHIDGNKTNNRVENLEWCTCKENSRHAVDTGLLVNKKGTEVYNSSLSNDDVRKIRILIKNGEKQADIAKKYNVSHDVIYHIAHNHTYKSVL